MNIKWSVFGLLPFFVSIIYMTTAFGGAFEERKSTQPETGYLVFKSFNSTEQKWTYYIANGDGSKLEPIGDFTGSIAISHDSTKVAVGCKYLPTYLCVYDISSYLSKWEYPNWDHHSFKQEKSIKIPEECSANLDKLYGIESVSWSWDDTKISYICAAGLPKPKSKVCITNYSTGDSSCWDDERSAGVMHIQFSPISDELVISSRVSPNSDIWITDITGKLKVKLGQGWSPAWSHDGKQIAYFKYVEEDYPFDAEQRFNQIGIQRVDKSGTRKEWIYKNSYAEYMSDDGTINPLVYDSERDGRIAWAPSNDELVFTARYQIWTYLFFLDTSSNKVEVKFSTASIGEVFASPSWN
jgi:hypothetical protein